MGRKPKIIPHIPGTMDSIVKSFFAKDRAFIEAKKAQNRDEKQTETRKNEKSKETK